MIIKNINTNGTKTENWQFGEALDEGFGTIEELFQSLDLGDGVDNNIINNTVLNNLYTSTTLSTNRSNDFSKLYGGNDSIVNSTEELKNYLIFLDDIHKNKSLFLFDAPILFPPRDTIPATPKQAFDFITFDSEANYTLPFMISGQKLNMKFNKIEQFLEKMWQNDPDFKRLIEALRLKHPNGYKIDLEDLGSDIRGQGGGNHVMIDSDIFNESYSQKNGEDKLRLKKTFVHEMLHTLGYKHETDGDLEGIGINGYVASQKILLSLDNKESNITINDYLNGGL